MIERPKRLQEVAALIRDGVSPEPETVRNFLGWFGAQRRGYYIVRGIRDALKEHGLVTVPDFESEFIDSYISFRGVDGAAPEPQPADVTVTPEGVRLSVEVDAVTVVTTPPSVITGGAVADPTNRIGKLSAANNPPISVQPDSSVREAVSLMLVHDFSQLPVMQSERDVKGIVRWDSIGARLALGCVCDRVRDCMEPWQEIAADASLFAAIPAIIEHQYVLVRAPDRRVSGIVTTTDLSLQFRQLAEPFLLLGEIENHIRRLIDGKYTLDEVRSARDPADHERVVESVADLTFGEYIRLLENPDRWAKLNLAIDRGVFVSHLDKVREIRNDVMHFDPDGIPESDLVILQRFAALQQRLQEVGAT